MFTVKVCRHIYDMKSASINPNSPIENDYGDGILSSVETDIKACHSTKLVINSDGRKPTLYEEHNGGLTHLILYDKDGGEIEKVNLSETTSFTSGGKPVQRRKIMRIIIENAAGKTTQVIPVSEPIEIK